MDGQHPTDANPPAGRHAGPAWMAWAGALLLLLPMAVWAVSEVSLRAQVSVSLLLVAVGLWISRTRPEQRLIVVFLSVAASARYIVFRYTSTLSLHEPVNAAVSLALLGAETYAFITLIAGYFQTVALRRNRPVPLDPTRPPPSVDVFIPTYNEPVEVLRPTIVGALALDYPSVAVWVLDDGRRPEVKHLAESLGARYITRSDNKGAKAGNINHALSLTEGELVAFFDADHIPVRSFLQATVGFFQANRRLALVQTPHHFYNPDPFQRNLHTEGHIPPEQHLFYHSIQLGNDFWNSAFFCGSCAVIRREALLGIGGVAQETVTEDAHTALRLHARGWDSLYLDIPLAAGLATETFEQHVGQRIRWARGMAQIFRVDNPLFKRGLRLAQRINYFNASWHFFAGLPRLVFVLAPPMYLVFRLTPVDVSVWLVLLYAIPHLALATFTASTINRNIRHSVWAEVYELAIAPYTSVVTALALVAPKRGRFNVTQKGAVNDETTFDLRHSWFLVATFVLVVAALVMAPVRWVYEPMERWTLAVASGWNLYNLLILATAIGTARERPQRRRTHRVNVRRRVRVVPIKGQQFAPFEAESRDMSLGGVGLEIRGRPMLPTRFGVEVLSGARRTAVLRAELVSSAPIEGGLLARCRFVELDQRQEWELPYVLFCSSSNWLQERYPFDSFARSMVDLIRAALSALLGRSVGRTGRLPDGLAPMLPGAGADRCPACGRPQEEDAIACPACDGLLHLDRGEGPSPGLPRPAERGWWGWLAPSALLAGSLLVLLGWPPGAGIRSDFMPEDPALLARLGGDVSGRVHSYGEARQLVAQFERSEDLGWPLPADWSQRVWRLREEHETRIARGTAPDLERLDASLYDAVHELSELERLRRLGADEAEIVERKQHVESCLDQARQGLTFWDLLSGV